MYNLPHIIRNQSSKASTVEKLSRCLEIHQVKQSTMKQCYFLIVNFKTEDTQILFHKTLQYLSARGLNI